ncbi:MAG: hypothetical protein MAG795_00534 [Candidatus Woesearchaeota archaeon]|nr:hypothetical protein [Candidatus Woesearchaeota archaeon]
MAKFKLTKKPKNPTIIEGFPGFGLVGTIVTEYLLEHLETERIGRILFKESPAMVAIHENKLVEPLGIFYNKKHNLVIVHAINTGKGIEWKIAENIVKLAKDLKAKEIISIEGVGTTKPTGKARTFYFSNNEKIKNKFDEIGTKKLGEGIIIGVTSALLLKAEKIPMSCVFAEAHTKMPDSKAAAKVVEVLDKYLEMDVDTKPLLKTAKKFEKKLKGIVQSQKQATELKDAKRLSYLG